MCEILNKIGGKVCIEAGVSAERPQEDAQCCQESR